MDMKRILSFVLICLSPLAYGQMPIVKCPIDTTVHFEISLRITQTYDDKGALLIDSYFDQAIPLFFGFAEFKDKESNEDCTPFGLHYENGQLYIIDSMAYLIDSTGAYLFDSVNTKKNALNHDRILSLKIEIRNETKEIADLNKIDLLRDIMLPLNYLDVSFFLHVPTAANFHIDKWNFIKYPNDLGSIYIEVPTNESKKKILKKLNRFEKLAIIEIHDFK